MKKYSIFIVALAVMMLTSCGTLFVKGGSNYRKGLSDYQAKEYTVAIDELNKAIAVNPEFEEVIALYPVAFNEGVGYYTSIVTKYANPKTPEDADTLYNAYSDLSTLYTTATGNAGRFNLAIKDVSQELSDAQLLAGQLWYDKGETLVAEGFRDAMIKAVSAFEKAKRYDPSIPGLDEKIAYAIEEATIRMMVLGNGRLEGFHEEVVAQFQETLGKGRFVEIVDEGNFSDVESMVGPLDLAIHTGMSKDVDYLLEVYPRTAIREIDEMQEVVVPENSNVFRGIKLSMGYQKEMEYAYQLFDFDTKTFIWEDTVQVSDKPVVFEITSLVSDKFESVTYPGDTKRRWDYLVTSIDNTSIAQQIIGDAKADLNRLLANAPVAEPKSIDAWVEYFTDEYYTFSSFVQAQSGKIYPFFVQAVILEAAEGGQDAFFMIGENPEEAFETQSIISSVNFALREVAKQHIESVKEYGYWNFENIASEVSSDISKLF